MTKDKLVIPIPKRKTFAFIVLIALLVSGFAYYAYTTQKEITRLNSEISELRKDIEQNDQLNDEIISAVGQFYNEYQEVGSLTIEGVLQNQQTLTEAIEVYDENVELYNQQIPELYKRIADLEEAMGLVAQYLSN